jgi:hypothetical protein
MLKRGESTIVQAEGIEIFEFFYSKKVELD